MKPELSHTELVVKQCRIQNAIHPEDYVNFALAYGKAYEGVQRGEYRRLDIVDIITLGNSIEPSVVFGLRVTPAHFANGKFAMNPSSIYRALESWREAYNDMSLSPEELYKEFEEIHPFNDGNGRAGHIIWALATYIQHSYWPMTLPPDIFGETQS